MLSSSVRSARARPARAVLVVAVLTLVALVVPATVTPAGASTATAPTAAPTIAPAVWSSLDAGGPVPVIVHYRDSAIAPSGSPADDGPRRAQVQATGSRVLASLPAGSATDAQRVDNWPMLALVANRDAIDALQGSPDVVSVTRNEAHRPALSQSVPKIGGPVAYAAGFSAAGQTVAILDTGVERTHPFLGGRVVAEACFSTTNATTGFTAVCPGGDPTTASGTGSAAPCPVLPDCRHGTHVAGIAAGDNGTFNGVAKDAQIIAVQIFSRVDSPSFCSGATPCALYTDFDLVRGLDFVYSLRATYDIAAANMSLGGFASAGYCDYTEAERPFSDLRSAGIAPVVAAGNDGNKNALGVPACASNAISVGATNKVTDAVASFSNSNALLALLAPGVSVNSSVPGGGYANFSGTSMATPHVVGAFAVLRQQHPTWTVADIASLLRATGLPITDPGNNLATPRIRLDGAVRPPTFHALDPTRVLDTRVSPGALLPGGTLDLTLAGAGGVPSSGVSAVVVNLTGVAPTGDTHLTMFPTGFPVPGSSNLNLRAGETRANQAVVKLGADGKATIRNNSGFVHAIVDVAGWLDDGGVNDSGDHFRPVLPKRLGDTRDGTGGIPIGKLGPGGTVDIDVASSCPGAGATAAAMNLTITNPSQATHLTMFPTGGTVPVASNLNVPAGATAPNLATVRLGSGGKVTVRNNAGSSDVIVDLYGCYQTGTSADTAGRVVAVEPARVVDTRAGLGVNAPGKLIGGQLTVTALPVGGRGGAPSSGMKAAIVNITATNNEQGTHLTVAPTGVPLAQLLGALNTSVLNVAPGQTVANLVQVPVGADGKFLISNAAGATDVIVDVVGWVSG